MKEFMVKKMVLQEANPRESPQGTRYKLTISLVILKKGTRISLISLLYFELKKV